MRRNVAIATAALLVLAFLLAEVPKAYAQEIVLEGPLVGQPAVRWLKLLRKGRISIAPSIGFTLVDDFRRNIIFGGKLDYNITDWFAIGVWGGYSLGVDTGLTKEIEKKAISNKMNLPERDKINQQIGKLNWILTLDLVITPLRGKIGLFSKVFVAADMYIMVGAGVAGIEDRGYAADEEAERRWLQGENDPALKFDGAGFPIITCRDINPNDGKADDFGMCMNMESRVAFVPTFGVGFNFFVNEWMALNLEYRAIPFQINKSGTDEVGTKKNGAYYKGSGSKKDYEFPNHVINADDRIWYFNHSFQISYAFYFNFGKPGPLKAASTD